MLGTIVATAKTASAVKAALVAVGVGLGASHVGTPPQGYRVPVVHGVPHARKVMTEMQVLRQIDHRLGVIERTQRTVLRGYESGGVYR